MLVLILETSHCFSMCSFRHGSDPMFHSWMSLRHAGPVMLTRAYQPVGFETAVPGSVSGNCAVQSKGHSGGAALEPTARCLRVSARNLAPAGRGCKQAAPSRRRRRGRGLSNTATGAVYRLGEPDGRALTNETPAFRHGAEGGPLRFPRARECVCG